VRREISTPTRSAVSAGRASLVGWPTAERGLSRDQLKRLIAAVDDPTDALLVRFLAETGLRFSEANALRWSDVESDRVVVWRRYRRRRMDGPKSRKAVRRVPISPTLARDLWQHRKRARWNADSDPV
jgi:integrase